MGNRAVIITEDVDMGLYLHWDGSPYQVQAFLSFCDLMDYRPPETDNYGWAQLAKVIGNYIDGNTRSRGLSIGLFPIQTPMDSPEKSMVNPVVNGFIPPENGAPADSPKNSPQFGLFPPENPPSPLEKPGFRLSPEQISSISPGDNGIYVIRRWEIIHHIDGYEDDEALTASLLLTMLEDINNSQPFHLPERELEAYVRKMERAHGETCYLGA